MAADGSNQRQLTNSSEKDDHACVSPDGKQLAFMSGRGGKRDVWLMPISGGPARRLTVEGENAWPGFSPDGKYIVWSSNRDGQTDLYVGKLNDD
jgi:Tol biopolymer transport system component